MMHTLFWMALESPVDPLGMPLGKEYSQMLIEWGTMGDVFPPSFQAHKVSILNILEQP